MSAVSEEIEMILASVSAALRSGAGPEEIASLIYDEAVVVVSEGAASAARGLAEVMPRMIETMRDWGPRPQMTLTLCQPVLAAEKLALTMVKAEIQPDLSGAPRVQYSAFMGWTRDTGQWRVAMEMLSSSAI